MPLPPLLPLLLLLLLAVTAVQLVWKAAETVLLLRVLLRSAVPGMQLRCRLL